ncbi:MAG: MerR family transcriptional regulator [Synergistota bacterium]|nr:MerR family transcriptional regulator [Synergistota bacterium]
MSYRMTIGEFSRLSRLSKKALRIYDEQGLLNPVSVDPMTGYRYYAPIQVVESERIRVLRLLDMPLDEIRGFLAERNPEILAERLDNYRGRLERKVSSMRRTLDMLDMLTMKKEEIFVDYKVIVKEMEEMIVISKRLMTALPRIGEDMMAAYGEVCSYMDSLGLSTEGIGVALYHCKEFDPEHMDVEVSMTTDRIVETAQPFECRKLEGCTAASVLHCGPYEGIQTAYGALYDWIGENGYEKTGPDREIYLNCPDTVPSPADLRTEIAVPVIKKA